MAPVTTAPSVLLVTLDTTRPDRLGCYGYERETSPRLDDLCDDAVVHTNAYSVSSWTLPAHASLFTGRFPASHGARYDREGPLILANAIRGKWTKNFRARGLAGPDPTLAETLREAGYATGAVVAGPWMKRPFGLDRGFDFYDDADIERYRGRLAEGVTDSALQWIQVLGDKPFFLFLNYYDPHAPYHPPPDLLSRFHPLDELASDGSPSQAEVDARYDAEILYMDGQIGRLLAGLRDMGLYDAMWIVVTADHGELLGEKGRHSHGSSLTEPELRIPLIVKRPHQEGAGGRDDAATQLTDVAPMLLDGVGLAQNARPASPSGREGGELPVLAEVHPLPGNEYAGDWYAIVEGGYKLVRRDGRAVELYHLEEDPSESRNLIDAESERGARLDARLGAALAALPRPPKPDGDTATKEVDEETRRALESLGYLEGE